MDKLVLKRKGLSPTVSTPTNRSDSAPWSLRVFEEVAQSFALWRRLRKRSTGRVSGGTCGVLWPAYACPKTAAFRVFP